MKPPKDCEPVGIAEIAELVGARPGTVQQWHYRGLLPEAPWEVSGRPAWNLKDIKAWAKETGRL